LVVEGEGAEVETFLDALQSAKAQFIQRTNVERGPATGQFTRFAIQA
jgi:acylphosphatase